jgi:hypothetical protein
VTSTVLTRWLRQGLKFGICPLCRASHKLDREFVWYFVDQWSMKDTTVDDVARARGLCAEHAEQVCRVEVDSLGSTLGIGNLYMATLERLRDDLEQLGTAAELAQESCPACVYREDGIARNARHLLDELGSNAGFREQLEASSGLCIPHFRLVWRSADSGQREVLIAVERAAAARLIDELAEHLRKQRAEFAHEPAGAEADSWQRAIWLTSGWPAPATPASVPEGDHPYAGAADGSRPARETPGTQSRAG